MVITDQFVVLNMPKTGSTFVRDVLRRVYRKQVGQSRWHRILRRLGLRKRPLFEELMLPNDLLRGREPYRSQHGTYRQIPLEHRGKAILTVIRHPCDRLVSMYEFRDWARNPVDNTAARAMFPSFPDLSFPEFVRFLDGFRLPRRLPDGKLNADIGEQTVLFFQFYARDPQTVLGSLTDEYIDSGAYRSDLADVTFLRTEFLNQDLHDYLLRHGFSEADVGFILQEKRIRPPESTRGEQQRWQDYFTPELEADIRRRERLLYRIGGYT
jgi:hypothetical protein